MYGGRREDVTRRPTTKALKTHHNHSRRSFPLQVSRSAARRTTITVSRHGEDDDEETLEKWLTTSNTAARTG